MEAAEKTHELRSTGRDHEFTLTQNTLKEVKKNFEETEHRRKESETELQQTLHLLAHEKAEKMSVTDALSDSRSCLEVLAAQVRAGKEMEREWRLEDTQRGEEEEKRRLEERRQEAARDVVEQTRREEERKREEGERGREKTRREEERKREEAEKKKEQANTEMSAKLQVVSSVVLCIYLYVNICIYMYIYTYIYQYTYMCMYIDLFTYTYISCTYIYMYMYISKCAYACMCMYVYIYIYMYIYMYTYVCVFICKCMYICIYIYTLTICHRASLSPLAGDTYIWHTATAHHACMLQPAYGQSETIEPYNRILVCAVCKDASLRNLTPYVYVHRRPQSKCSD